jgi:hypothetical protein
MSAVTKEDVARLHAYLVVPVAVNDALASGGPLEGDVQYGLHVALSEIDPDSALLAIALSAHRIAQEFAGMIPMAAVLKLEAGKIIDDYGPEWLANYHNHPVGGEKLFDLLCHVPDDLESIADLLDSLQAFIRDEDHPAHALCAVLAVQARAHKDIAEYVLEELANEFAENIDEGETDGVCQFSAPTIYADNIVLFPLHKRR